MNRKSVRKFTDEVVSDEIIHQILDAGMSGPSCVNSRDWAFLVITEKDLLVKCAEANGRPADPLKGAAFGIMVLGDLDRAFEPMKDFWIIDGAIAGQNMVLAAEALGLGSVWLGTWPQMDKVQKQRELFGIPEKMVPHSIIAFGYNDDEVSKAKRKKKFEEDRVHFNKF